MLVIAVVVVQLELNNRPDLSVWHTTVLDQEFNADSAVKNFAQYLELEERLFEQLDQEIYRKIESRDQRAYNRYHQGSLADPGRWPTNWNRSFVLPADKPEFGVLLLHGMSDSPYSLRSTGQLLHGRGGYVIGLRVPGHGQAPSGLLKVRMGGHGRCSPTRHERVTGEIRLTVPCTSSAIPMAVRWRCSTRWTPWLTAASRRSMD